MSPIFGKFLERPIGKSDMEHYYGGIVLRMALLMSSYPEERWEKLSHRTKQKWLDRASYATFCLLNDEGVVAILPGLAKNLSERLHAQKSEA